MEDLTEISWPRIGARVALVLWLSSVFGVALAAPAWPLKINAGGRYLEDQNSIPFLITADAPWCIVTNLSEANIDTYLGTRRSQGFNAVQFALTSRHSGCDNAIAGDPDGSADLSGVSPFGSDSNWSSPNSTYWTRVDVILNKIKALDMLAIVAPAYLGFDSNGSSSAFDTTEGWGDMMEAQTNTAMTNFGTFVGNRYKTQGNLIWLAGGDASVTTSGAALSDRVNALFTALVAADTSDMLVTAHSGRTVSGFEGYGAFSWLTLNSAYDGDVCPDNSMAADIATEYARIPARPVLSIEQRYDEEGATAGCLADQYGWSALAGGVGHCYGNASIWAFPNTWDDPGRGINSPIVQVQTNFAKLVRSRKFWQFAPDQAHTVVTSGFGSGISTVATTRASTGETVMAYVPTSGTQITVAMTNVSGTSAVAYWYDPRTNAVTLIGTYPTTAPVNFTSPGSARVLVVDDASKQYPPPASADAAFDQFPPPAVAGVQPSKVPAGVRVAWISQNPPTGVATSYDVVTGLLSDLRAAAGYDASTCLANDLANTPFDDSRGDPIPGDGHYYLVRASGTSGAGTYGPAALDASSPCP